MGKVMVEVSEPIGCVIYPRVVGIKNIPEATVVFERMVFPNCSGTTDRRLLPIV